MNWSLLAGLICVVLKVQSLPSDTWKMSHGPKGSYTLLKKDPATYKPVQISDWSSKSMPMASIDALKQNLLEMLSTPRNHEVDPDRKNDAMIKIVEEFQRYGLDTEIQAFNAEFEKNNLSDLYGMNIIGVMKGENWGTPQDELILIGSHYDTDNQSSAGMQDNGSGVSAMLEVARVMSLKCKLKQTIFFVAFDLEEYGMLGSKYFVSEYLIPQYLMGNAKLKAAFVLDKVLNFDSSEYSQFVSIDLKKIAPQTVERIMKNKQKGDFLEVVSRTGFDDHISRMFTEDWKSWNDDSMKILEIVLPEIVDDVQNDYSSFIGSDHSSFWFHDRMTDVRSLGAVLLTDTGSYRGRMANCYHKKCDSLSMVTEPNLKFLKKTTDTLIKTVKRLAGGVCGLVNRQNDKAYYRNPQEIIGKASYHKSRMPRVFKRETEDAKIRNKEDTRPEERQQTPYSAYISALKQSQGIPVQPGSATSLGAPIALSNNQQTQGLPQIPIISNTPKPKPQNNQNFVETQGNYILPESAILAMPSQQTGQSTAPISSPPLQQQASSGQLVQGTFDFSATAQQQQQDPNEAQASGLPLLLGNIQQTAENTADALIGNNPDNVALVQQRVRVPLGLVVARNAYTAFMNGMRRIVPILG